MKKLVVVCVIMLLILAGCGNKADRVSNKKEVSFGEMMQSGTKWFYVVYDSDDSISKDNDVKTIIKAQNGKISTYNLDEVPLIDNEMKKGVNLGQISKMSDKEIEKVAKNGHQTTINNQGVYSLALSKYIKGENISNFDAVTEEYKFITKKERIGKHTLDGDTTEYSKKDYDKSMKYVKEAQNEVDDIYKKTTKPYQLNIKVKSDDSGNETSKEKFNIGTFGDSYYDHFQSGGAENKKDVLELLSANYTPVHDSYMSFSGGGVKKIYDTNFAFMDSTENSGTKLITKVGDKVESVKNDKPNAKYVKEDNE